MSINLSNVLNEEKILNTKTPSDLIKLRKEVTKKILIDCEVGENSELVNELNRLGCITTEEGNVDVAIYSINDDGEIEVGIEKIEAKKHTEFIKNTPDYIIKNDIDIYNKIITNEINTGIEKIISNALVNIKYEHEINSPQSFISMIRKIPKPFRNNLVIVGDNLSIATLKLILARGGYNQDDILGLKYYTIGFGEEAYILNLKYLKINYLLNRIEDKRYFIEDTHDTKIVGYGEGKIVCDPSAIKIKISENI